MEHSLRRSHVRWFSDRPKNRKHRRTSPQQIVSLRLHEFARLFGSRYRGTTLPNDDSGRDDIEPVIHHLASLPQPARRARQWLELWAPWLTLAEQRTIIGNGIANARAWSADQIAWRYRISKEERAMLGLTTIGAFDYTKATRTKHRKQKDRQRKAAKRRAAGVRPRKAYEGDALSRMRPWLAEGISRRTWYRRRASAKSTGTGPSTA